MQKEEKLLYFVHAFKFSRSLYEICLLTLEDELNSGIKKKNMKLKHILRF